MAKRTLQENINQVINDLNEIKSAIETKGVEVPAGTPTRDYSDKILNIETGVDVSADTVVAAALRAGFTAHEASGAAITGTIQNYEGAIVSGATPGAQAKYEEGYADGQASMPDLSKDTVTPDKLVLGETAHDASGAQITGTLDTESIRAEGVEAGKIDKEQELYNRIMDSIQNKGERTEYRYFFWAYYPFDILPPKYDIELKGATAGISAFAWNDRIKEIAVTITLRDGDVASSLFNGSRSLHTLKKLVVQEGTKYPATFQFCDSLANLPIEGTIGQNGFDVSWSPLSKASLTSVVNALSSTTTGLTVTLRLDAVNTAFETSAGAADGSSSEEWLALAATKPNWTINLINS